jgi:uncharacterized protein YceH (UPF0502 family)
MPVLINETEARILGSLVEKQLTTPEYYPLTLNALTAACNQKSNRDPVMSLDETAILAAVDSLRDKNLVYLFYGSSSRTVKYKHMLPGVFELEPPGVAVMALLLLRGPQTVGELRGRSDRLYEFAGLSEVQETLDDLAARGEPLVLKLERQPGQKEARYAHLLSGDVDPRLGERSVEARTPGPQHESDLATEVKRIADELAAFRAEFEEFKKQFE